MAKLLIVLEASPFKAEMARGFSPCAGISWHIFACPAGLGLHSIIQLPRGFIGVLLLRPRQE
ncbi:MAG: hypothetical protein ACP5LX_05380, partial [Nitrososphaeria archaeon]